MDNQCDQSEATCALAARVLPLAEAPAAQAHLAVCGSCRREFESLAPAIARLTAWRAGLRLPTAFLQRRLAARIAAGAAISPFFPKDSLC